MSIKEIKHTLSRAISRAFTRSSGLQLELKPIVDLELELESLVPHLLNSNLAPNEAETAHIEEMVKSTESNIDAAFEDLHTSKGITKSASLKLEMQIAALTEFKQIHESLLSPIRRFPFEILALIFLQNYDCVSYNIPWVSQVCHFWREVALSTPSLWTSILLDLDNPGKFRPRLPSQMSIIDLKLERSLHVQLKIDIRASAANHPHAGHPALQKLLDCSDRWRDARLFVSSSILPWLDRIKGRLPSLYSLKLSINGSLADRPFCGFEQAPSLRQVFMLKLYNVSLPWDQLSHFKEYNALMTNTEQKIRFLTSASDLHLYWRTNLIIPTESLICSNLESLYVSFEQEAHWGLFLKIQTPRIKEISIHGVDPTACLTMMIRNTPSPCLLQILNLHHDFDHPDALSALLRLTPRLEELDIHLPHKTDLRQFVFDPTTGVAPLVPKLRKLGLRGKTISGYEDIIRQIASSRCELVQPFSTDGKGTENQETVATLISFMLEFPNASRRLEQIQVIETSPKDCKVPEKYFRWALVLHSVLGQRFLYTVPDEKSVRKVKDIFLSLLLSSHNVHYIHATGIPLILLGFVESRCHSIPEEFIRKYKLRDRAQNILKRWEKEILLEIPNWRWRLGPFSSLIYVPIQADLRSTDPLAMVYGPLNKHGRKTKEGKIMRSIGYYYIYLSDF